MYGVVFAIESASNAKIIFSLVAIAVDIPSSLTDAKVIGPVLVF